MAARCHFGGLVESCTAITARAARRARTLSHRTRGPLADQRITISKKDVQGIPTANGADLRSDYEKARSVSEIRDNTNNASISGGAAPMGRGSRKWTGVPRRRGAGDAGN